MFFKDLQKNTPFFIINNTDDEFKVHPATITSVSQPRFENITNQFSNKVIDLNVTFGDKHITYTVLENAENMVFAQNGSILVLDQQNLISQLKSLKLSCETAIKEGEISKNKIGFIDKCLEEYDVSFKEKKEYEIKINSMESKLEEMNKKFNLLLEKLSSK